MNISLVYSPDARRVHERLLQVPVNTSVSQALMQSRDDGSYKHVPLKPAFTVQATYKLIGKLKPRQFPLDE